MAYRDPNTGRWASPPKSKVFVYGTLKSGYSNNAAYLNKSTRIGKAVTEASYKMLNAGYPVVMRQSDPADGHKVVGEIYEVDAKTMARLDRLEGEGRMYDRKVVECTMNGGGPVECFVYEGCAVWNTSGHLGPNEKYLNADGELEWRPYYEFDEQEVVEPPESDEYHDIADAAEMAKDEAEVVEPEDQTQGDLEGVHDEREQP